LHFLIIQLSLTCLLSPSTFLNSTKVAFKEGDKEITTKRLYQVIGPLAKVLANIIAMVVLGVLKGSIT
jgi:hypothetical protein